LLESYLAVQQHLCQMKEFLIDYELHRAIVSNMPKPNFAEELFNSTLSATRYSSIYDYINKSKMYRNY
uniref:Uncharacterized protein n=1 Tax=Amphimedon queenslandica TaxID=400682 RepID=A0A1X7U487_AMPQE